MEVLCKCCGKPIRFPVAYHTACYEVAVEKAAERFCRDFCRFPKECDTQEELDEHCDDCPFIGLSNAIGTAPEERSPGTDAEQRAPAWQQKMMRTFLGGKDDG